MRLLVTSRKVTDVSTDPAFTNGSLVPSNPTRVGFRPRAQVPYL